MKPIKFDVKLKISGYECNLKNLKQNIFENHALCVSTNKRALTDMQGDRSMIAELKEKTTK